MPISLLKALVFLSGGIVAAGTVGYVTGVFDDYFAEPPAMAAALPEAGKEPAQPATPIPAPTVQEPAAKEPAPSVPAAGPEPAPQNTPAAGAEDESLAPRFDLVRVEPDGSVVIAGNARGGADVEILSGTDVIAVAKAEPEGDFVVVLDDPLKPGDYAIVLRATNPDKSVATSTETAVVSVPDDDKGQVLALVEEPGKPSRLITVPEAQAPQQQAAAASEPASGAETTEPKPEAPQDVAAATPAQEQPAPSATEEPAATTNQPSPSGEASNTADTAKAADSSSEPPASQPAAPAEITAPQTPATPDQPAAEQPVDVAKAEPAPQLSTAKTEMPATAQPQAPAESTAAPADKSAPQVVVEAVEIEGRTVFVAGSATPGSVVRVYATDMLLGETRASQGGRFLIETQRDLPVGDYIIRADLVSEDGRDVLARAAVPFQREAGEMVAAVAAPQPAEPAAPPVAAAQPSATAAPATPEPVKDAAAPQQPAQEVAAAPKQDQPAEPSGETQAAAQPATEAPAQGQAEGAARENGAATARSTPAAPSEATAEQPAQAATPEQKTAAAQPAVEATAPKLQPSVSGVIIRRGDSLWRISRRIYGRGVRYSTIYVANKNQIANPDLIWPGQVFRVPETTDQGETADLDALSEQITTIPADDAASRTVQ